MSLQLILGNSGSGKSYTAYQKIIRESMENPQRKFLVIVPEQFTMQIQKELVRLHPKKGILNIDVLSFQRLAYRIFEEVGADKRKVLEETGKNLLLKKTALEQQAYLKVLGGNLHKFGYITEMKSVISELTQYDISLEQFDQMVEEMDKNPALSCKMQDIRILYEAFREKIRETYITSEEILGELCQVAVRSDLLRESVILLDEFTGFTPIQQKLLRELMTLSKELTVTVTLDADESIWQMGGMHELFYLSKKTIHILRGIAGETKTEIQDPILMGSDKSKRFAASPALAFLEQHILRPGRAVYGKEQDEISIHGAKNPVEEAHFAGRSICRLVREKGYRYQDIAVITGDMASYGSHVERIFEMYQIPCFIDQTKTILLNPLIEFIRAALEMLEQNFSYPAVFRYLRTGLCGVTTEEIDLLENYVLATGKRGLNAWKKEWVRPTGRISAAQVEVCEELRKKVLAPLLPFVEQMKGKNVKVQIRTEALYDLIFAHGIQEQLVRYEQEFREQGNLETAREYSQIYRIVIELFDKVVDLLGEEVLTRREYTEILDSGFEEAKVGSIPPRADQVMVGDIERTRLKDIKALFFLGLNDGWVPKSGERNGILSELDRESLKKSGVELAPGARENAYIQRFYLYQNLTKPSEKLYLSYSKSKTDGGAMRPSYLISRICKMYPALSVVDEDRIEEPLDRMAVPENGILYLIRGVKGEVKDKALFEELFTWYWKRPDYRKRVELLLQAAFLTEKREGLGKEISRALYGTVLENSVSRLERFAACAYAHFLIYGLELAPREEYIFQPMDMGNVYHDVLERFSKKLENSGYTWFDLSEELQKEWVSDCVEQVAEEYGGSILQSSARNAYIIKRMKRIMERTLWALCTQIRAGKFVPRGYEVSFSLVENLEAVNIALTDQEKMKLRGRIDRIDTCEEEDQVYVKVIDYKSGNTEFDMVALYYGLQLQLVVYLNAAMELERRIHPEKEVVPAGIFYYRVQDPLLEHGLTEDPEEINREILKKLKVNGLVNAEDGIVRNLDTSFERSSDVIPVAKNKDGSYSRYSSVADRRQFADLSAYVNEKMKEIGSRILEGEVEAKPYVRNGRTACDYCGYREVCGFDPKIPGTEYRRLREWKPEEIWAKLREEE